MYNTDMPPRAELPTSGQLLRSTLIAAGVAAALLVTVVLPAEYNIDPTGAGRALGLTEMGEIKTQLAREAETDRLRDQAAGLVLAGVALEILLGAAKAEQDFGDSAIALAAQPGVERAQYLASALGDGSAGVQQRPVEIRGDQTGCA